MHIQEGIIDILKMRRHKRIFKKVKVAVLLFGQPRYINVNYKALKEEFCYSDGTPFDFFCHFWKDVGFSPKGESENKLYDYTAEIKKLKNI